MSGPPCVKTLSMHVCVSFFERDRRPTAKAQKKTSLVGVWSAVSGEGEGMSSLTCFLSSSSAPHPTLLLLILLVGGFFCDLNSVAPLLCV